MSSRPARAWIVSLGSAVVLLLAVLAAAQSDAAVFGTKTSQVFHTHECGSGKRIAVDQRRTFASEAEAISAGRRKCKLCAKLDDLGAVSRPGGPSSVPTAKASARRPAVAMSASMPAAVRVTGVLDGDTLRIEGGERVRLMGASCPESDQRIGEAAKRFVEQRVFGRTVQLTDDPLNARRGHRDQWGRWLAYVRIPSDGGDLSEAILAAGLGWYEEGHQCSRKEHLLAVEQAARKAGKGIWKLLPPEQGNKLVFVSTSGFSYHPEGCQHLKRVKVLRKLTLNEAIAAGFRPCPRFTGL